MSFRLKKSFGFAFKGFATLIKTQPNARIHLAATVAVAIAGALLRISREDWMFIFLAYGLVWTAEALNTGLEFLADAAVPRKHPLIAKAKDVAAAGVLCAAIAAVGIGVLVFGKYLH